MPRKSKAPPTDAALLTTTSTLSTNDEAEGRSGQGKGRKGDGRTTSVESVRQTSGELLVLDDAGEKLGMVALLVVNCELVPAPFKHPSPDLCALVDAAVAAYLEQERETLSLRPGQRVATPDGPATLVAPYFWAGVHDGSWCVQRDDLRPPPSRDVANGWTYLSFYPGHQISPEAS